MHTTRSTIKVLLAALASLALICVTAGAAFAAPARPAIPFHAAILSSDPAIGSMIAQAPTKITVFTAENMNPDPAKSNLQVYGPSAEATNALISQGNAQIPLSNQKQMSINITPTTGHTSGVYIVFWKTVSQDDGDPDSGSFTFTVNPAASSTPAATATKTTAPATTTTNTNSGAPLWVPIVAALVALIVGLGAGFGLGRRKPAVSSIGAMRASIAQDDKEAAGKRP